MDESHDRCKLFTNCPTPVIKSSNLLSEKPSRCQWLGVAACFWILLSPLAQADVIVHEGIKPNDAWPKNPVLVVGESPQISSVGLNVAGNVLSQTFVAPKDFTLKGIALAYWTEADNAGTPITLHIFEVPDPNAAKIPISGSPELLGEGSGLDFTTTLTTLDSSKDQDLLVLEFSGGDQLALSAGKAYVIQLSGSQDVSFTWGRLKSGGTAGGQGYVNEKPIYKSGPRDFKMALYDEVPVEN